MLFHDRTVNLWNRLPTVVVQPLTLELAGASSNFTADSALNKNIDQVPPAVTSASVIW